jgi:hypothetical protein
MPDQVIAEQRICRTEAGELVLADDPRSRFLAYAEGAPVEAGDVDAYQTLLKPRRAQSKAATKPADKATVKPDDK